LREDSTVGSEAEQASSMLVPSVKPCPDDARRVYVEFNNARTCRGRWSRDTCSGQTSAAISPLTTLTALLWRINRFTSVATPASDVIIQLYREQRLWSHRCPTLSVAFIWQTDWHRAHNLPSNSVLTIDRHDHDKNDHFLWQ